MDQHSQSHIRLQEVDRAAVGRIAHRVDLQSVRLTGLHANLNVKPNDLSSTWPAAAILGFDPHLGEVAKDGFDARVAFFVAYHPAWEPNEPPELPADSVPHLDLTAMFLLTFSVRDRETVDVSDLEHFVVLNATFNAWPYWRELVQSTTLRMGIPPLIVPVFVFPTALGNRAED